MIVPIGVDRPFVMTRAWEEANDKLVPRRSCLKVRVSFTLWKVWYLIGKEGGRFFTRGNDSPK